MDRRPPPDSGAAARRRLSVRNPLTGEADFAFEAPSADDLDAAIAAMRAAQPRWAALGAEARAARLRAFRDGVEACRADVLEALSADTGRRALARQEFDAFLGMIARWADLAPRLLRDGEAPSAAFPSITIRTGAAAYPVVAAISPWNFPLLLAFIDAAPALAAGSAVFIKPSDVTPRFCRPLCEAIASVPDLCDVLTLAAGDGETGAALIPRVDAVAFTGSVATGRKVAEAAAQAFIPAFLELGGKDPAIILESADLDRAATAVLRASIVATGQACQSIERIYAARSVFDAFVGRLVEKASRAALTLGRADGIVGPLIFERQAAVIAAQLDDARAKGARILCGGVIPCREGATGAAWIAPTVVTGVTHDMALMQEETFGPIMPVMAFDDVDEAVRLANDSIFGLSAAVFASDEAEAIAVAERLEAGGVSINDAGLTTMVFEAEKSAFKLSGMGPSRMGPSGLTRFLRRKAYYVNRGAVVPIDAFAERDDGT